LHRAGDAVEKRHGYLVPDFTGEARCGSATKYDDFRAVLCNGLQAFLTQRFS
jgi:hypothetical protein